MVAGIYVLKVPIGQEVLESFATLAWPCAPDFAESHNCFKVFVNEKLKMVVTYLMILAVRSRSPR